MVATEEAAPAAGADALIEAGAGSVSDFFTPSRNARGIPEAVFIENVELFCSTRPSAEVVAKLQELYSKYQYMQSSLLSQRGGLRGKLPGIVSALEMVRHLIERRDKAAAGEGEAEVDYTYQLSENLWTKATVPTTNVVCLWLGANVMLEYTLDEALELLTTNESNARTTLKSVEEDMAFLRDQLTTTEVNIARVHNYTVKLRQKQREDDKEKKGEIEDAPAARSQFTAVAPSTSSGGDGRFTWKQESEEVELSLAMPEGSRKEEVKVTILMESIKIEHKGKVILEGDFAGKVSTGGSTWTMSKGRVEVTLEKAEAKQWPTFFSTSD